MKTRKFTVKCQNVKYSMSRDCWLSRDVRRTMPTADELGSFSTSGGVASAVIASFLCWSIFYYILCIVNGRKSKSFEWNCRLVTSLHAFVAVALACYSAFVVGPWPFMINYTGQPNSHLTISILVISLGYFIFDVIWCVYFNTEERVMVVHHVVSICSLLLGLVLGESGAEITATLAGSEVSNPLLQLRWFLYESNLQHTRLARINEFAFGLMFLVVRLGPGTALCYYTLSSPNVRLLVKAAGVAFYGVTAAMAVQIIWFLNRKRAVRKIVDVDEKMK